MRRNKFYTRDFCDFYVEYYFNFENKFIDIFIKRDSSEENKNFHGYVSIRPWIFNFGMLFLAFVYSTSSTAT